MSNQPSAITSNQLRRAIAVKEQIEALTDELNSLLDSSAAAKPEAGSRGRKLSASGRAAIVAAQKARWAKKGGKAATKGKRKMSAAGRAKISAAAKERWKKAKAAGKTRL